MFGQTNLTIQSPHERLSKNNKVEQDKEVKECGLTVSSESIVHLVHRHEVVVDSREPGVLGGVPLVHHAVVGVFVQVDTGAGIDRIRALKKNQATYFK